MEVVGDLAVHEYHEEVVEGVHRPAQVGGDEGVALILGESRCLFPDGLQHADPPSVRRSG